MKNDSVFTAGAGLLIIVLTAGCVTLQHKGSVKLDAATRAKAVEVLQEGLKAAGGDNFWPSIHAAEALTIGGYGSEVREHLTPKLSTDRDAQHRCGIARELVRAGDTSRVKELTAVLISSDPHGHVHAAESLFKVYQVGDPDAMRRHFAQRENMKLHLMAAAALARQGDLGAVKDIRGVLRDGQGDDVQIAAWILGQIGNRDDIEPLRMRLADAPTPLIRAYIEHALAMLGDPDGIVALGRNLDSEDTAIRTYAANFAGDAGCGQLVPKLTKMLDDPNLDARIRAAQALLTLEK